MNRNNILISVSVVLFLCAGLYLYIRMAPDTVEVPPEDMSRMVAAMCAKCSAEWQMPYQEWQSQTEQAKSEGKSGILCPKCGEEGGSKGGVIVGNTGTYKPDEALPPETEGTPPQPIGEEEALNPDASTPAERPRPMIGRVANPN